VQDRKKAILNGDKTMKIRTRLKVSIIILILVFGSVSAAARSTRLPDADAAKAIDELLTKTFKADEPGAAVLVIRDGKVILRKGYGLANIELGVPIQPDMVFRLGSITKQFTASAILMLSERGKLAISDEITKYLPDYPVQGHKITIEHLLTHTSGIKSYTGMPEWRPLWRKDFKLDELIDFFKNQPMEFAPGERWNYNNSGYVLLGAIIEKVSGQSYEDFLVKNIFEPLEMKDTYYDNTLRIIPRRVSGYSKTPTGYRNAEYLSMTQPHAAGSLMSTVDDLAKWNAALLTDKLIKQETLKRAWTPYVLKSGKPTKYGYGWYMTSVEGSRTIEHGGGINGFVTDAVRLPGEKISVVILTNREAGLGELAHKVAALAAGKVYKDLVAINLPASALDRYVGVYKLDEKQEIIVRKENDSLTFQHPLVGTIQIAPFSETEFFVKEFPSIKVKFIKNGSGSVSGLTMSTGIGADEDAKKSDKPIPAPMSPVEIDPAVFDGYTGEYEVAPGFVVTVTSEGGKLMGQATGQPRVELHAESKTKFLIKEVGAQVEFIVDSSGRATSIVIHQGGQKLPAKRIR